MSRLSPILLLGLLGLAHCKKAPREPLFAHSIPTDVCGRLQRLLEARDTWSSWPVDTVFRDATVGRDGLSLMLGEDEQPFDTLINALSTCIGPAEQPSENSAVFAHGVKVFATASGPEVRIGSDGAPGCQIRQEAMNAQIPIPGTTRSATGRALPGTVLVESSPQGPLLRTFLRVHRHWVAESTATPFLTVPKGQQLESGPIRLGPGAQVRVLDVQGDMLMVESTLAPTGPIQVPCSNLAFDRPTPPVIYSGTPGPVIVHADADATSKVLLEHSHGGAFLALRPREAPRVEGWAAVVAGKGGVEVDGYIQGSLDEQTIFEGGVIGGQLGSAQQMSVLRCPRPVELTYSSGEETVTLGAVSTTDGSITLRFAKDYLAAPAKRRPVNIEGVQPTKGGAFFIDARGAKCP